MAREFPLTDTAIPTSIENCGMLWNAEYLDRMAPERIL
jgi:hypothetical protein